jgi:hypothetical protein
MQLVRESASQYTAPDFFLGNGIPNLELALNTSLSLNTNSTENLDIQIYPNPVKNKLFIKSPVLTGHAILKIYSILGEEISTLIISENMSEISTISLAKGIYIVKLDGKTFSKSIKLIKQ